MLLSSDMVSMETAKLYRRIADISEQVCSVQVQRKALFSKTSHFGFLKILWSSFRNDGSMWMDEFSDYITFPIYNSLIFDFKVLLGVLMASKHFACRDVNLHTFADTLVEYQFGVCFQSRLWPFCPNWTEKHKGPLTLAAAARTTLASEKHWFPRRH